jgi:hypothetical protein
MDYLPMLLQVAAIVAIVVAGIVLLLAPISWIAWKILSPIDRAAKFRKAPVRFSVGDFLCLFLAIQIPLAAVHGFLGPETMGAYWTFTLITWLVAPMIWYFGGQTLSRAQVTRSSHRFVLLGLILPLVYYGLVPFTALGIAILARLLGQTEWYLPWLLSIWLILAALLFLSGRFVRWMLQQVPNDKQLTPDPQHENELFPATVSNASSAAPVHEPL